MAEIQKRAEGTIEDWRKKYSSPLQKFASDIIGIGLEVGMDIVGEAAAPALTPLIDKMLKTGEVPPELKPILDEIKKPTGEVASMFAQSAGSAFIGGAIGRIIDALLLRLAYSINSGIHPVLPNAEQFTALWRRGVIKADELTPYLRKLGLDDISVHAMQELSEVRLDADSIITAWRRDPEKWQHLFKDLVDQGWDMDRINAAKFITEVIPQAPDIIRFALREVYTPEIAEKYGQFQDIPTDAYIDAEKAGLPKDTFDKFWAAHWYLPSSSDGFEMMHRGVITEDELRALLKANDVMPYWRDKLMAISWAIPTRVDVRRFWEMRTIDEARLREIYTGLGYHGKDLDDYVLWTKIYVDFPDLVTRFKNGWLSLDELRAELRKLGLSEDRAEELIQTKVKAAASEKLAKDKDLTAAEIIKGVKKEVITWEQGLELLEELGYDEWEAEFKLAIEVAVLTGSPESFEEFKSLTSKFKIATGREEKPMTEELKKAADELVKVTKDVEALRQAVKDERAKLEEGEPLPAEATRTLKALQVKLYRAEAELARVKNDYERQVAAWRYST